MGGGGLGGFGVLVTQRQRVFERLMAGETIDEIRLRA